MKKEFTVGSRQGGKVKYNRPGGAVTTVNRKDEAAVLRAINVCCAGNNDVDGIPERMPTAEECAAADEMLREVGDNWQGEEEARKSDTYDYLKKLSGPSQTWLQRAQERHNKKVAKAAAAAAATN